ncbi:hypothetical protein [Nocardia rhizosphaerihabitans]|uniref:Uncharacterized protein n=1 Tax=Nocardia rhizosphaerihabitans TaxID=1691570 RepID=A0ABQ2KMZ2_9NOCA|nr:hypothetical protein [Nocardia rhizosphaerihabitans]GGN87854.1 hypothetical protein GCM10011610_44570 [Nocardia rhizosphaerihabitans]
MFEESRRDGHDAEPEVVSTAEIVAGWELPAGAFLADTIRRGVLATIDAGYDDPAAIADLAIGPLVIALGRLEVDLADARTRIAELERRLGRRG